MYPNNLQSNGWQNGATQAMTYSAGVDERQRQGFQFVVHRPDADSSLGSSPRLTTDQFASAADGSVAAVTRGGYIQNDGYVSENHAAVQNVSGAERPYTLPLNDHVSHYPVQGPILSMNHQMYRGPNQHEHVAPTSTTYPRPYGPRSSSSTPDRETAYGMATHSSATSPAPSVTRLRGLHYDVIPKRADGPSEAERKLAALTQQLETEMRLTGTPSSPRTPPGNCPPYQVGDSGIGSQTSIPATSMNPPSMKSGVSMSEQWPRLPLNTSRLSPRRQLEMERKGQNRTGVPDEHYGKFTFRFAIKTIILDQNCSVRI